MATGSDSKNSNTSTNIQIETPPLHGEDNGYQKLASAMGMFPEVAIFRRFSTLNVMNILYLQAELVDLEEELRKAAERDALSGDLSRREYHRDWYALSHAHLFENGDRRQWELCLRIRKVLHDYNTAVIQQKELVKMVSPSPEALSSINEWMTRTSMGSVYLIGEDRHLWKTTERLELLALDRSGCDDLLSAWMTNSATTWFHWAVGRYFKKSKPAEFMDNTVYYSQKNITRLTSIIVVSLSSILPLVSILVLSKVHKLSTRLWIIGGCTVLFSLCLGLVASPRKVEIFSAAAAFAAVQVVFIGGNGPSS